MPPTDDFDDSEGDPPPKPSLWMRFQTAIVKPDDLDSPKRQGTQPEESIEELQATIARADDKERNIGLIAAPIGAVVALLITANLINHAKSLGQSTSVYQTLTFVLLGLAALMLGDGVVPQAPPPGHRAGHVRAGHLQSPLLGLLGSRSSWPEPGSWCAPTGCKRS